MRLGLGPKPGGRARIVGSDPDSVYQACLAELNNKTGALIADSDITVTSSPTWAPFSSKPYIATAANVGLVAANPLSGNWNLAIFQAEDAARYVKYLKPEVGFVERLVLFWNNHFSLSHKARPWLGLMERAAIRTNVLGYFGDMLEAVETHPAMIAYLDNNSSVGPNSVRSVKNPKANLTYNENLAREILELHTVGVYGGYTQADVTSFAKVITGWQIANIHSPIAGQFVYNQDDHEPGAQTIMGKTYGQADGLRQGKAVLRDLATHPSTAHHIAYKLIKHFITDDPSDEDVATLQNAFLSSNGNLQVVSKALLDLPSTWTEPFARIRKPYVWMVSMLRGLNNKTDEQLRASTWTYNVLCNYMGHYPWSHITPDGYPDDNDYWMTSDAVRVRNDIAGGIGSPGAVKWAPNGSLPHAEDLLGTCLSNALSDKLSKSTDDRAAFPLLFMSPEYLWS